MTVWAAGGAPAAPPWTAKLDALPVVFAWGVGEDGQTGIAGRKDDLQEPLECKALRGVQLAEPGWGYSPLVAASRGSLVIGAAGECWSWGWNQRGTTGHGHKGREPERLPRRIEAVATRRVQRAAGGGWHSLAVDARGQTYAWGGNEYGQCGLTPGAANATGEVAAAEAPAESRLSEPPSFANGRSSEDGAVPATGPPRWPARAERDVLVPRHCLPAGVRIAEVAAGGMHSIARTFGGEVWQWGQPVAGSFDNARRVPHRVPGLLHVVKIAAGAFHNLALDVEETVKAWGRGDYGQLGHGSTDCSAGPLPVAALDGLGIVDVTAGGWHSAAVTRDGQLFTWGRGEYGRLGLGAGCASRLRPHPVDFLSDHAIVQASAGGTHTLALTSHGRVFVFGRGAFGRLGVGPVGPNAYGTPLEVVFPPTPYHRGKGADGQAPLGRVVAYCVAAGGRHSLAACVVLPPLPVAAEPGAEPAAASPACDALLPGSVLRAAELPAFWWSTSADQPECPCGSHAGGRMSFGGGSGGGFIPANLLRNRSVGGPAAVVPEVPGEGAASSSSAAAGRTSDDLTPLPSLFRVRRSSVSGTSSEGIARLETKAAAAGEADNSAPLDGAGQPTPRAGGSVRGVPGEGADEGPAARAAANGSSAPRAFVRRSTWSVGPEAGDSAPPNGVGVRSGSHADTKPPLDPALEREKLFEEMHQLGDD